MVGTRSTPSDLHFQLSPGLLVSFVVAIVSTVGVGVTAIVALQPPGPPPVPGLPGRPPSLVGLITTTGLCVLAWVCVIMAFMRDQLIRRLAALEHGMAPAVDDIRAELTSLRAKLAQDRQEELAEVERRIIAVATEMAREYGDQRETEGYLSGMRTATSSQINVGELRTLRSVPRPD